jgi:hypothetical protein
MVSPARKRRRVPELRPGRYADGRRLDQVQYLESKIILKPDRFASADGFWEFAKIVRRTARKTGVGFSSKGFEHDRPQIREVVFLDTADFRLYNNAFILRRRIPFQDGFPVGDPEVVLKFRHPDIQKSAKIDVCPRIDGAFRIKFKAEALPLKDQTGSLRMLYSHNVEFPLSHVHEGNRTSRETLTRVWPVLGRILRSRREKLELVNHTIVEEVLQDIAILDFGKGIEAKANVALWRSRGDHAPLVGEFAFQIKFKKRQDLSRKAMKRAEQFFVTLQEAAASWLLLGATKTGIVYRLQGNPPQSHE